ncbi:MAG: COG4705 family protein [Solirubrobacteraceae bacterium]
MSRASKPTGPTRPSTGRRPAAVVRRHPLAVKVPQITLLFWVLKLLTTGMGEAMSDFMGQRSVPIAAAVGIFGLGFALWLQLRTPVYRAAVYWFAVMMVAIFGTMAADGIHIGAGIPYSVTTPVFAAIVAVIFWRWQRSEGTLSIHTINTRRRELYYWTAVLATFALGTAAGDLTAYSLKLGFWVSALLFAVVFALPGLAYWRGKLNPTLAFWAAYVVTRPLGASFADGFSKPTSGGLHWGDGTVSALALVVFVALVAYVAITGRDIQLPHAPHLEHASVQPLPAES